MIDTTLIQLAVVIAFSAICLVLTLKSTAPIINFIVGCFTLIIAATTIGLDADLFFNGWIQIFAFIMALVCMLSGYMNWKR